MTDPHSCITGTRCRSRDGDGQPANTARPGTLCDACLAAHTDAIGRLLRDYAMLYATIGERQAAAGETVKSSRNPAIPINVHAERLMAEIVECAQRGAIVIARQLNTALPATSGRKLPPARDPDTHKPITAEPGSIAARTAQRTAPTDVTILHAYLRLIEPHIEDLAYEPAHRTLAWARPERCADHQALIEIAEAELAAVNNDDNRVALERARLAAANCDPCNGWGHNGQAFGITYVTGHAIVERLTELHHTARQHLGHTRLRHRFDMPCPNCHAQTVGRDNGQAIIDCRTCEYAWTEREYKLLVGMHVEDELEETVLRPQLDEANGRLDSIANLVTTLESDPLVSQSEAVQLILGQLKPIMDGHQPPEQRTIGYDVTSTIAAQAAEDDWTWKKEQPYKKPRKKSKQTVAQSIPRIKESSRSLVTDDTDPDAHRGPVCTTCNLIHTGECP